MFRVAAQYKSSSVLPLPGFKKKMFSELVDAAIITKKSISSPTTTTHCDLFSISKALLIIRSLSKIIDEMKNDDKEDNNDTDPSQSLSTSQESLQSVQSLRAFFLNLSSTDDDQFRALDSMQTLLVDLTV
ncbi:hypothetical protein AVEN_168294-1 [Araneus ventricosus]|uniref:Uncharacterized protein n=1 Tax=Araneus ventricosus TaxID=182803 RepID=A0A4Y2U0D5_ARAVE|nr:hypothetical protein AVEN_168294-1 [Araneus ventricosus]